METAWNAKLYDDKHSFVSAYGEDLIELLQPRKGERILDLGCGTGDLANKLSALGAEVTGLDASAEMIGQARVKYSGLEFICEDAQSFRLGKQVDAVISNAALHWMKNPKGVLESVARCLKPGGRFVLEMGGKGNVACVVDAVAKVLAEDYGIDAAPRIPWYFPAPAEYCRLLEDAGFTVRALWYFERPTRLEDGERGLANWLKAFGNSFFYDLPAEEREKAFARVSELVQRECFQDNAYVTDYVRLRVLAVRDPI